MQIQDNNIIGFLEKVLLIFILFALLTIKVFFLMYANPLPDEAYYWVWSNKIALSYFDHPPLATWTQAFLRSFSDNKYFVLRAFPVISLGIVLLIMLAWQRHMSERFNYVVYLKNVVLFLSFPIFAIFFSISFPDYLLITLLFASSFCLFLYFERNESENKGIYYWYLAVLLFSLALLTKYNAILFGIGVLTYILYYKKKIAGPSYGHIVASIFIIFLIQTPVIFWNLGNDFASFSFHMDGRLDKSPSLLTIFRNLVGFLLGVLLAFSPIFIFNLRNYFFESYREDRGKVFTTSKFVLICSVTFCIFLSFFTNVLYYWLTPAIVLFIPILTNILRLKMWRYLHIFYGMLVSLILVINMSFYPISAFVGNVDRETAIVFGWQKIIGIVNEEKKLRDIKKIIFSDYRLGSLYIFHSGDFEVDVVMEERSTQFDIWRDSQSDFAATSLIVADKNFPIGRKILSSFKSIQFIRDIEIKMGNNLVKNYQVFLGANR